MAHSTGFWSRVFAQEGHGNRTNARPGGHVGRVCGQEHRRENLQELRWITEVKNSVELSPSQKAWRDGYRDGERIRRYARSSGGVSKRCRLAWRARKQFPSKPTWKN